jgi:NAD(P)H-hydrate epimerase
MKKKTDHATQFPPLVIDADALRLLPKTEKWYEKLPSRSVLTPHPGEMSALTGLTIEEIQKDRMNIVRKYAVEWQQVVVLKGALTLVASPTGKVAVIPFASSVLAKAGTGDVLAGLIAGLISQGVESYGAAQTGAWIHAQAGKLVKEKQGSEFSLLASDLLNSVPDVLKDL